MRRYLFKYCIHRHTHIEINTYRYAYANMWEKEIDKKINIAISEYIFFCFTYKQYLNCEGWGRKKNVLQLNLSGGKKKKKKSIHFVNQ